MTIWKGSGRGLAAALIIAAPVFSAHADDAFEAFDLATGLTSSTDASVLLHARGFESGGTRPLIVLESAAGQEILRVEFNGNGQWIRFSDGEGRHYVSRTNFDYGFLLTLRLHGTTYEAVLDDGPPILLQANVDAPATRAWSNKGSTNTRIVYYRVAFARSDLVATTFRDGSLPGWTDQSSLLGRKAVAENQLDGDRSLGFVWVHGRAAPLARDSLSRPLGTATPRYRASGAFALSPYVEDLDDGIALLAGLKAGGAVAWGVIARSIGYRTWRLEALDGDGDTQTMASLTWEECSCNPWLNWHTLDFDVDDETGAWSVSLDGAAAAAGTHGSDADEIAFGDVFDGAPALGPSGAGGVRIDNVWTAGAL